MANANPTIQDVLTAVNTVGAKVDRLENRLDQLENKINGLEYTVEKINENTQQTLDLLDVDLKQAEQSKIDKADFEELHRKAHLTNPTI